MTVECATCDRPVVDTGYACWPCTDKLAADLADFAEIASELETTVTRQDKLGEGTGGRASAETPVPFNDNASEVGWVVRNTLTTWARVVLDTRGLTLPDREALMEGPLCRAGIGCQHDSCLNIRWKVTEDPDSLSSVARFLRDQLKWIRCQPFAQDAFEEIGYACRALKNAVDAPVPMTELGECETEDCEGRLRAPVSARFTRCRECEAEYDVAERRRALLNRAEDRLETATGIADILTAWGVRYVPVNTVYTWANRRQLVKRGTDRDGRPLYRLGEARQLAERALIKQLKQAA